MQEPQDNTPPWHQRLRFPLTGLGGWMLGIVTLIIFLAFQHPNHFDITTPVDPAGSTTVITIDNADLSHTIAVALQGNSLTAQLQNVTTHTDASNNTVEVDAEAHMLVTATDVVFVFAPVVDPQTHKITTNIVSAQVGNLPVTGLTGAVEAIVDAQLNKFSIGQLANGLTWRATNVRATDTDLVITASLSY